MATAISAIGNKGRMVEPRLVKSITNSAGEVIENKETVLGDQIVSESAAIQTLDMMKESCR